MTLNILFVQAIDCKVPRLGISYSCNKPVVHVTAFVILRTDCEVHTKSEENRDDYKLELEIPDWIVRM